MAGVRHRASSGFLACVSRGRCGGVVHLDVAQCAFRVAGAGNRARSVTWYVAGRRNRAWQLRRRDFVAALCEKTTACTRVGVLGENPWICGCKLVADVSQNALVG